MGAPLSVNLRDNQDMSDRPKLTMDELNHLVSAANADERLRELFEIPEADFRAVLYNRNLLEIKGILHDRLYELWASVERDGFDHGFNVSYRDREELTQLVWSKSLVSAMSLAITKLTERSNNGS
jgi:hypothetical protein